MKGLYILIAALEMANAVSKDAAVIETAESDALSLIYCRHGRTDEEIDKTARTFKTALFLKYQIEIKIRYRIMEDNDFREYVHKCMERP